MRCSKCQIFTSYEQYCSIFGTVQIEMLKKNIVFYSFSLSSFMAFFLLSLSFSFSSFFLCHSFISVTLFSSFLLPFFFFFLQKLHLSVFLFYFIFYHFLVFWVLFFWFLGFIFLCFLGFIFLGFILWVGWVGLIVMMVGLW